MSNEVRNLLRRAVEAEDISAVEALIREHPGLISEPDTRPVVTFARTARMAERLMALGADVEMVSKWWGGGLGLRQMNQGVAEVLVKHGAALTVHAAAGLGLTDRLSEMLNRDPKLIDAKGCDGCTPLHFARDCATARILLAHGARVDARDDDHDSTPAQWLIGDAPEVGRLLLENGASPDIFLAAALGDSGLAKELVSSNRACLSYRIGKAPEFPPIGYNSRGGSIYQWTLAFNSYPHQVALLKGHTALFDFLFENSDTTTQFLVSCLLARREVAEAIAKRNPGLISALPSVDLELVAKYCWETNLNYDAVKLMLDLGFPVDHPERAHGYSPLHNAAWAGEANLVELLLQRGHPVDIVDPVYHATPFGFAMHDFQVEKRHPEGEFARVFQLLLDAGSPWNAQSYPTGDTAVDAVLKSRLHLKP